MTDTVTVIASLSPRHMGPTARRWFVASVPTNGSDWGYTEDRARALPLTQYWADRFAEDCREVGSEARFSAKTITAHRYAGYEVGSGGAMCACGHPDCDSTGNISPR